MKCEAYDQAACKKKFCVEFPGKLEETDFRVHFGFYFILEP